MFGVLSKIAGYVWAGANDGTEVKSGGNKSESRLEKSKSSKNAEVRRKDIDRTNQRTNRISATPSLKKVCSGKITHLYDGSGIIENDIYFTFDVVLGGYRPELGENVHVIAKREKETEGWKAVRVEIMSEWKTDNLFTGRDIETFVGSITKLSASSGVVNQEINFDFSCLRLGFVPFQGDWVKLDIERPSEGVVEVKSVTPLREKTFTGRITSISPGFGCIDDEVYFGIGGCSKNYRPRRGDVVNVTAIESHQGRLQWRALKVELKKNIPLSRSRNKAPRQSFMGQITAALVCDKEGVTITNPIDFGDVQVGKQKALSLWIRNLGDKTQVFLSCSSLREDGQFHIYVDDKKTDLLLEQVPKINKKTEATHVSLEELLKLDGLLAPGDKISPGESGRVVVCLQAKTLGRLNHLIVFSFQGFEIGRHLMATVKDPQEMTLMPTTPYDKSIRRGKYDRAVNALSQCDDESWVIPGERPTRKKKIIFPVKLKQYNIPRDIKRCILEGKDLMTLIPALGESLTMRNYQARFSTLLYAEELQQELDIREFDLQNVMMNPCGEFLSLVVPRLAEGRPSLLIGDKVEVTLTGAHAGAPRYEGYIHEVRQEDILLKFHNEFHNKFGMQECDVIFFFNRSTLRRAHQAVEFAINLGEEVLFPRQLSPKLPVVNLCFTETSDQHGNDTLKTTGKNNTEKSSKGISLSHTLSNCDFLYNSNLNERQRAAVTRILGGQCRPTPYLLFGPPGTGKTVTLVEAILQVFHRIPSSRILACAPSNSASDLIAQRLHQSGFIQEGDMVRLNALQRGQEVPEIISQYCTDTDDLVLASHFRIVICTCSTSGQLFSLGLKSGHFTHVFVDEAGQATEPECLIPVGLAAGGEGQVILAGDPYQLGAVLRSPVALDFGLNISLLERLISRSLYKRDERKFSDHGCYDPLLVTKLVNNYRAHPSLLHPSSALFYHGELQVHADRTMRESLCRWELLPNPQVPIIFHGMKGEDLREGNSPSWFNPVEAVQVTKYIQALRTCKRCTVKLTDIGIITPYRKQVEKIRLLLSRLGLSDVKVGSVEEFQGQERMAIILSTVRSDEHLVDFDAKHCIGFLSNPKRFNVAITRAQALLVIVGNPHVLCKDPYWCTLLRYCIMNDAYTGCDLPNLQPNNDEESFDHVIDVLRVKSEEMKKDPSYPFVQGEVEAKGSCMTVSNNSRKPPACVQSGETGVRQRTLISPLRTSKPFPDEFKNLGLNAVSLLEEEVSSAGDKDLLNLTKVSGENSLHTTDIKSEDSFNIADVRSNSSLNTAGLEGRDYINKGNINGEESLKIANIRGNESLNTSDVRADDARGNYSLNAAFVKVGGCLNTSDVTGGDCFNTADVRGDDPLNDIDVKGTTDVIDDDPLNDIAVKGTTDVGNDGPLNDTAVKGTTDVGNDGPLNDTVVKCEQSFSPMFMKDDVRRKYSLNTTQYDNVELEEKSFSETRDGRNESAGDRYVPISIAHLLGINPCAERVNNVNEKTTRAPSFLRTLANNQSDLRKGLEFNDQTTKKDKSIRKENKTACNEQPYCDVTQNECESVRGVVTTTDVVETFNLNVSVEAARSENDTSMDSEEELEEFLLKPISQRKSPLC